MQENAVPAAATHQSSSTPEIVPVPENVQSTALAQSAPSQALATIDSQSAYISRAEHEAEVDGLTHKISRLQVMLEAERRQNIQNVKAMSDLYELNCRSLQDARRAHNQLRDKYVRLEAAYNRAIMAQKMKR